VSRAVHFKNAVGSEENSMKAKGAPEARVKGEDGCPLQGASDGGDWSRLKEYKAFHGREREKTMVSPLEGSWGGKP